MAKYGMNSRPPSEASTILFFSSIVCCVTWQQPHLRFIFFCFSFWWGRFYCYYHHSHTKYFAFFALISGKLMHRVVHIERIETFAANCVKSGKVTGDITDLNPVPGAIVINIQRLCDFLLLQCCYCLFGSCVFDILLGCFCAVIHMQEKNHQFSACTKWSSHSRSHFSCNNIFE